jgi:hypothetical protein
LTRSAPFTQLRTLIPTIVLLCGALAAWAWFDNEANRGITYEFPEERVPQPIPHTDVSQLGVNAYNLQFEPDQVIVTRTLEAVRALGARYVRMQMPWEDVEIHGKGDFEDRRNPDHVQSAWDKYDFIMAEMQRLELEPIVRIDRPPRWARAQSDATEPFQNGLRENGNSTGPPDSYQDYADFVAAVAARYRGTLRYIQIWNEPNLAYEWNWVLPEPERFAELLRISAEAARRANPEVVILFPSLSPTDGLEPRIAPLSELDYLDRVYRAGGGSFFDIMSAQAYGLGQPPDEHRYVRPRALWNRPIDTRIDVSRVVLLREVMVRNGDAQKAVWISEFGYVSAPPDLPHSWGVSVSEEQRAAYLVGQLERARREWPWVGVMNVWFLRWGGAPPDPRDPTAYFAILGQDFTPTPAYAALSAYAAHGAVAGPGAHQWSHPAIQQTGPETWQIRFAGQSLELVNVTGPFEYTLDGSAPVPLTPLMERTIRPLVSELADGEHLVTIHSPNGPPSGIIVERTRPYGWFWAGAPIVLLAALAAVCARAFGARAKNWPPELQNR